jgi:hypothetical protein
MARKRKARAAADAADTPRLLDARRDTLDFRDLMYEATLVEVPAYRTLDDYRRAEVPILDQGREGACTGFGLATVAHYLLRTHRVGRDATVVSPYMFYDLARRYDEWAGEDYEGSSCRGAMKGWYKHGICARPLWPQSQPGALLDQPRVEDAARRPLGAYLRVNHTNLVAMHAAITETGILFASSSVHSGWQTVGRDGLIKFDDKVIGGHAFAIVAYDADGFWIQNSWGTSWGKQGFGHIAYDDWLKSADDVWVARLGVPVRLETSDGTARASYTASARAKTWSYADLRPHVVSIGAQGALDPKGDIGTTPELVREIVRQDIPRITAGWKKKRIVLYAHGGLVKQGDALQRVNEYRDALLAKECYPLAFIWHSDFWTTVKEILADAATQRRPEGFLDATKDFMLDRLDDMLEPLARVLGGREIWSKMKDKATGATLRPDGGARLVADELAALARADRSVEIHVVAHSAGSVFHAPLVQYLAAELGLAIKTCTLWAPALTTARFRDAYLPLIRSGAIGRFALFQLDERSDQDDNCAGLYNKSLLYLVAHAFEEHPRVPLVQPAGEPLLGLQKCVDADPAIRSIFSSGVADRIIAPTSGLPMGNPASSEAKHHADFDDDRATVLATLARILGSARAAAGAPLGFTSGEARKRETRRKIDKMQDVALTR